MPVAAIAAVVAVAAAAAALASRARVTGGTPAERIASICRLADEQPWGAAGVIAAAAAREPDARVRRAAVVALSKFMPDYRRAVEAATRDPAAEVRAAAAGTLGYCADTAAAERLGQMFNDPKEEDSVRAAAVAALAGNNSATATVLLVTALESHPSQDIRDQAAAVLVKKYGVATVRAHPQAVAEYRRKYKKYWLDTVETIKMLPETKSAFRQLGRPLVMHPENVLPRPHGH